MTTVMLRIPRLIKYMWPLPGTADALSRRDRSLASPAAAADYAGERPGRIPNRLPAMVLTRTYGVPVFLACVLFFLIWPDFDLTISRLFYNYDNHAFLWSHYFPADVVYTGTHVIGAMIFVILISAIAASYLFSRRALAERRAVLVFLLSAAVLGPGLLVNLGLKDHWGRPRPRQVVEFGGDETYEPPLLPGSRHADCHSFVSGHASIGFYFFGLALLSRSRKWLWLPIIGGAAIGATRIAQGAHFFSDVLFSGWVVWFSTLLLHAVFSRYGMIPARPDD